MSSLSQEVGAAQKWWGAKLTVHDAGRDRKRPFSV